MKFFRFLWKYSVRGVFMFLTVMIPLMVMVYFLRQAGSGPFEQIRLVFWVVIYNLFLGTVYTKFILRE